MKRFLLVVIAILALGMTAIAQTSHGVDLTWNPSVDAVNDPALTYNVYRLNGACPTQLGNTTFTKVNTTPVTTTEYFDAVPAANNAMLCYYTTAVNLGLESGPSNLLQLVYLPPPFPPTGLKAITR